MEKATSGVNLNCPTYDYEQYCLMVLMNYIYIVMKSSQAAVCIASAYAAAAAAAVTEVMMLQPLPTSYDTRLHIPSAPLIADIRVLSKRWKLSVSIRSL